MGSQQVNESALRHASLLELEINTVKAKLIERGEVVSDDGEDIAELIPWIPSDKLNQIFDHHAERQALASKMGVSVEALWTLRYAYLSSPYAPENCPILFHHAAKCYRVIEQYLLCEAGVDAEIAQLKRQVAGVLDGLDGYDLLPLLNQAVAREQALLQQPQQARERSICVAKALAASAAAYALRKSRERAAERYWVAAYRLPESELSTRAQYLELAAEYYWKSKAYDRAGRLWGQALKILTRIYGRGSAKNLSVLHKMIDYYKRHRKDENSALYYSLQLVDIKKSSMSQRHPGYRYAVECLARGYFSSFCARDKAEALFENVLIKRKKRFGYAHPDTVDTLCDLAFHFNRQQNNKVHGLFVAEYDELLRGALSYRKMAEKKSAEFGLRLTQELVRFAGVYSTHGEYCSALERLLFAALKVRYALLRQGRADSTEPLNALALSCCQARRCEAPGRLLSRVLAIEKARHRQPLVLERPSLGAS